jgi:hypothetical protein
MKMKVDLDNIRVASPCNARWDDMAGDERVRFCTQCRKNVFNLSAMTRSQIETLIREKEGKFCGRFYQRPDGRMITADCPTGQRRRRNRLVRWGGAVFATLLLMIGVRTTSRAQEKGKSGGPKGVPTRLMGEVSVAPARMGDIASPYPVTTNRNERWTNCPVPNRGPRIMGRIAVPWRTNQTAHPASAK